MDGMSRKLMIKYDELEQEKNKLLQKRLKVEAKIIDVREKLQVHKHQLEKEQRANSASCGTFESMMMRVMRLCCPCIKRSNIVAV